MSWLPQYIFDEVNARARVVYVNSNLTKAWNAIRGDGELRLLTGWAWMTHNGQAHRQGFKTRSVCYRDAYYSLVRGETAPYQQPEPVVVRLPKRRRVA